MLGIYFSGTGNTKYCVKKFLQYYDESQEVHFCSIEDNDCINKIREDNDIVFAYPVYYSDMPVIVKDFLNNQGQKCFYYLYNGSVQRRRDRLFSKNSEKIRSKYCRWVAFENAGLYR